MGGQAGRRGGERQLYVANSSSSSRVVGLMFLCGCGRSSTMAVCLKNKIAKLLQSVNLFEPPHEELCKVSRALISEPPLRRKKEGKQLYFWLIIGPIYDDNGEPAVLTSESIQCEKKNTWYDSLEACYNAGRDVWKCLPHSGRHVLLIRTFQSGPMGLPMMNHLDGREVEKLASTTLEPLYRCFVLSIRLEDGLINRMDGPLKPYTNFLKCMRDAEVERNKLMAREDPRNLVCFLMEFTTYGHWEWERRMEIFGVPHPAYDHIDIN